MDAVFTRTRGRFLAPRLPTGLVAVAGLVSVAAAADDRADAGLCLFRRCTGGYCPGCGSTRAAVALARGRVTTAWAIHPWIPLLAAQALLLIATTLWSGRVRVRRVIVPLLACNAAFAVVLWAMRLATGSIPAPFG